MSKVHAVEMVMDTAKHYKGKWCSLVTIDVKNAFSTACHSIIIKELRDRNISTYLVNVISSYLTNRKIMIGQDEYVETNAWIPQGSVLGPILWNVLHDGVLGLELIAVCVGYADDLALVVEANDDHTLITNTNLCLERIGSWMSENKLVLAPDKSEAIIMQGRRRRDHIFFTLEGTVLKKTIE